MGTWEKGARNPNFNPKVLEANMAMTMFATRCKGDLLRLDLIPRPDPTPWQNPIPMPDLLPRLTHGTITTAVTDILTTDMDTDMDTMADTMATLICTTANKSKA